MRTHSLTTLILFTAYGGGTSAFGQVASKQGVDLAVIPAISQDPTCPPEGWCGEASIQMAAMYYGCYFPQKMINAAGHPNHPDLWNTELAGALEALGFGRRDLPNGQPG